MRINLSAKETDKLSGLIRMRALLLIVALVTGGPSLALTSEECKTIEDWAMAPFGESSYRRSLCFDSFVFEEDDNSVCANMPGVDIDQDDIALHELTIRKMHGIPLSDYAAEVARCFGQSLERERYRDQLSAVVDTNGRRVSISFVGGSICYATVEDDRGCFEISAARTKAPLHYAVSDRDQLEVEELIRQGVNVDIRDENGWTPLFTAIRGNSPELVALLLEYGADINATTLEDLTPLHLAANDGRGAIVELLVDHGALLDMRTDHGAAALHIAIATQHCEVVKILIEAGADVYIQDGYGETPVQLSSSLKGRCNNELR